MIIDPLCLQMIKLNWIKNIDTPSTPCCRQLSCPRFIINAFYPVESPSDAEIWFIIMNSFSNSQSDALLFLVK